MEHRQAAGSRIKKRKADSDGSSERLSKVSRKLSLLNLELNGNGRLVLPPAAGHSKPAKPTPPPPDNDVMQMDNTSHKVYIYNLDDELSDSDSSVDDTKLVFLPDIEKHLRQSRIPASVLMNSDGELAGRNISNELVLYNVPTSLSVPEGQDSVRKAIIETRARAREKARREQERARTAPVELSFGVGNLTMASKCTPVAGHRPPLVRMDASNELVPGAGVVLSSPVRDVEPLTIGDPDAMDLS